MSPLRRLPDVTALAPGASVQVVFDPFSRSLGGSAVAGVPAFPPGWYCLQLSYSLEASVHGRPEPFTVYSAPFYVGP